MRERSVYGKATIELVSNQEVIALSLRSTGLHAYCPPGKGTSNAQMVSRVGSRIANAVESFYTNNGYASELERTSHGSSAGEGKQRKCFRHARGGGKGIVIYSGLLPGTQTEEALAGVEGHEMPM